MAMTKDDARAPPLGLLIANRGEIALRIQRSALLFPRPGSSSTAFTPYALVTPAEAQAAHALAVPPQQRIPLPDNGPKAYLDARRIVELAKEHGVWGVIPGYGFLSESADLARQVEDAGLTWVGPTSAQLELLSNKLSAKQLARQCDVPTLECTANQSATPAEIRRFADQLRDRTRFIIVKAVSGGGGRGMRLVDLQSSSSTHLEEACAACVREAKLSFDDERIYAERYLEHARHIEVQVVGDGTGDVAHLWDRECSLQRRHQKMVEIAPSPSLSHSLRMRIIEAALRMAKQTKYRSLGTFEFLVVPQSNEFFFMEVNPRIQVEHTVTEQVTSLDLVSIQLQIALGMTLKQLGLGQSAPPIPFPTQTSIQVRLNAERCLEDGNVLPTSGSLVAFNVPFGPGVRVDTCAHAPLPNGTVYKQSALFDSLLAKLIFTSSTYELAVQLASRGLSQVFLQGVETNLAFLRALIDQPSFRNNDEQIHTRFVEQHYADVFKASQALLREEGEQVSSSALGEPSRDTGATISRPEGSYPLESPLAGLLAKVSVKVGDKVHAGQEVALVESMKMEHVIRMTQDGVVEQIDVREGVPISQGESILSFSKLEGKDDAQAKAQDAQQEENENSDAIRPDLAALLERREMYSDQGRSEAVKKRHEAGFLTARENVALLVDDNTFIEWGDLQFAAQRTRRDEDDLREKTSNDGVITGWALVNSDLFKGKGDDHSAAEAASSLRQARCALCIYDYMVLAGTQGFFHHLKLDRLFRSVLQNPAPIVVYAEGGGGRPADVDVANIKVAGLDTPSFALLAAIRSRGYPSIGLANGYTFAGNAALLGTCDIVVATEGGDASLSSGGKKLGQTSSGMGGPAMIEGGGLGKVRPQDVGPLATHVDNGDYDVVVANEREAATMIKRLLSFFQGPLSPSRWQFTQDVKRLRTLLPQKRTRAYDVRSVISTIVDDGSFIELGKGWGASFVTGLARIEGQPVAILASSVLSPLGGAIDAESAQKAIRLVNMLHRTRAAHLVALVDTPGFMVGPEAEKKGGLRIFAEFFAAMMAFQDGLSGGRVFAVTIRKGYGLGSQAVLGGSSLSNFFHVAWPQGEYAGMGIEGAVRLGMRKELEAAEEGPEREELFASLVEMMYARGQAQNVAAMAEIDTVIDPAETRQWLVNGLRVTKPRTPTWQADRGQSHSSHL